MGNSVVRWWCWRAPFLLFMTCAGCGGHGDAAAPDEGDAGKVEAHVAVRTEPARLGAMTETVEGLGRCEALPDHIATLTPAVEGHVHELLVKQGDAVKKGQPIVELDRAVARADLAEKTATRDGLKASLALLKSLPRPEERRANELAVEQAKVAVERAKAVAEGSNRSRGNNLTSRSSSSSTPRKALEAARVQQKAAEATLQAMMIGPRPEAVAEAEGKIKTADALVALLPGPSRLSHDPRADRRHARQPDVPPRPDDRDRHPDRRGGRYAAGLRVRLAPDPVGFVRPCWAGRPCLARGRPRSVGRGLGRGGTRDGRARSRSWDGWPTRRRATCRFASWWITRRGGSRSGNRSGCRSSWTSARAHFRSRRSRSSIWARDRS